MVDLAIDVCEMNPSNTVSTNEKKDACCCDEIGGPDCCTTSYIYYFTPKYIQEERSFNLVSSIKLTDVYTKCTFDELATFKPSINNRNWIRHRKRCNSVSFVLQEEKCVWII